jgi:hypothetical protein
MPLPDASPLSSEERALARHLAGLDEAAAEPSAALDARVLAAARHDGSRPMPRQRRWPAAMALAASLMLAVGVAWRLHPLTERATPPTDAAGGTGVEQARRSVIEPPGSEPVQARMEPTPDSAVPAPPTPSGLTEPARKVAASPPEPSIVPDRPARRSEPTEPSPMALPPPPAPPAPARESELELPLPSPAADAPAPSERDMDQDPARTADQAHADGTDRGDEPEDDVPPATADSPAVRDAWLQRIQGFVDSGDIAAARASLHAFAQRYPDYPLPENLRALGR